MAPGDVTPGTNRPDCPPWDLKPGDYCVRRDSRSGERVAWVVLPNGNGPARLQGWGLTEHEDGTITVSPSILMHASRRMLDDGTVADIPEWHGYLERGVWREV